MNWTCPIPYKLIPTADSMSFQTMTKGTTGLPLLPHPGAWGAVRKHDTHTGVDLYCEPSTPVLAVEKGIVVAVIPFTGAQIGMDWWEDTDAVMIEGESGVVLYGEITPHSWVQVGWHVGPGDGIGYVKRVLKKYKGRPMSMLHLELYKPGSRTWSEWTTTQPEDLLDPTEKLATSIDKR